MHSMTAFANIIDKDNIPWFHSILQNGSFCWQIFAKLKSLTNKEIISFYLLHLNSRERNQLPHSDVSFTFVTLLPRKCDRTQKVYAFSSLSFSALSQSKGVDRRGWPIDKFDEYSFCPSKLFWKKVFFLHSCPQELKCFTAIAVDFQRVKEEKSGQNVREEKKIFVIAVGAIWIRQKNS